MLLPFLGVSSLLKTLAARLSARLFFLVRSVRFAPISAAMHNLAKLLAVGFVLVACVRTPDDDRSCARLAEAQAAAQMERETSLLEQHEQGLPDTSGLQREFIAMDAKAYRAAVYEECLRRRGLAAQDG